QHGQDPELALWKVCLATLGAQAARDPGESDAQVAPEGGRVPAGRAGARRHLQQSRSLAWLTVRGCGHSEAPGPHGDRALRAAAAGGDVAAGQAVRCGCANCPVRGWSSGTSRGAASNRAPCSECDLSRFSNSAWVRSSSSVGHSPMPRMRRNVTTLTPITSGTSSCMVDAPAGTLFTGLITETPAMPV